MGDKTAPCFPNSCLGPRAWAPDGLDTREGQPDRVLGGPCWPLVGGCLPPGELTPRTSGPALRSGQVRAGREQVALL